MLSLMLYRGRDPTLSPSADGDIELPDPIELLTAAAVREMLARPDADTFLEWIRREGPKDHPGVFSDLETPELWPSFATNLGVGLWNAMPFPNNGFRPHPLPKQKGSAPCRCRSGKKYGRCCARLPGPPSFPSYPLWAVMLHELDDEVVFAAAASLQMPADFLLQLAQLWQRSDLDDLVLKLLEPVFRKLPKILTRRPRESQQIQQLRAQLEPLLKVFVYALMEAGSPAKERRWRKRLLAELPEELQGTAGVLGI